MLLVNLIGGLLIQSTENFQHNFTSHLCSSYPLNKNQSKKLRIVPTRRKLTWESLLSTSIIQSAAAM